MIFNAIIKNRDVIIQGYPILVDELPTASHDIVGKIYAVGTTSPRYYICEQDDTEYKFVELVIPEGIIEITNLEPIDVTKYASAQVIDSNLIAENIVKDITVLGVTGTYEYQPILETKTENITQNGSFEIVSTEGFDGLEKVIAEVNVDPNVIETTITDNGTYEASAEGANGYSKVIVNVAPYGEGIIEIDENGEHDISGKATAIVNVPIPEGYVKPEGKIDISFVSADGDIHAVMCSEPTLEGAVKTYAVLS